MTTTAVHGVAPTTTRRRARARWTIPALAALLVIAVTASITIGAYGIALPDLWGALTGSAPDPTDSAVLWQIRLPRIALALLAGAALALAGVVMQGLFANPLAEPGLVGVSSGAAVGAVLALTLGATAAWMLPTAAFVAGLATTVVVYALARVNGRTEVVTVILTGIAINAFAGAVIGLLMSISDDAALRSITFWTLGSVSTASWSSVTMVLVLMLPALALLPLLTRPLDVLALGERNARYLGIDVVRTTRLGIGVTALLSAAVVAVTGIIGFIGLVVPHAVRGLVGPGHRRLMVASALAGALLLVVADLLARTVVAPREIPLGVLTGLIGAPAFFVLLRREHKRRGAWA